MTAGRIVQLPHLERMFAEATGRPSVVPIAAATAANVCIGIAYFFMCGQPLNLKPDELNDIVRRLAPSTDGLGLEQVVVRARIPNPRNRRTAGHDRAHFSSRRCRAC